MTGGLVVGKRRIGPLTLLSILIALTILVALLTPEATDQSASRSSYNAGIGGTRMVYELAQRMGWQPSRRVEELESSNAPAVQVVLEPEETLGAVEVHRLLDNVRRGGGLIFDVAGAGEIADSIGVSLDGVARTLFGAGDASCVKATSVQGRAAMLLPPSVEDLRWKRPPPGVITPIKSEGTRRQYMVAAAFPMGAGRVVALASASLMSNAAVRVCEFGADVISARALEFVRPASPLHPRIVFDEFHHGYGAHGGSLTAVSMYLARTMSGHFLAQALIAALILLLAKAPRPIVPQEPERIQRRSPLEHADALAHAYADVGATRTMTSRLVSGLRRRAGRTVAVPASADDAAFLGGVVRRTPSLAPSVGVVRRALSETVQRRDIVAVADAVREIERQLTTTPPTSS